MFGNGACSVIKTFNADALHKFTYVLLTRSSLTYL